MNTLPKTAGFPACAALLSLALALPQHAPAQSGIGDIVYTVGTVARDAANQDWAYILWQGTQPGLISNRVFAVYSKPGTPTNSALYTRRSIVSLETDALVIEPLLRRAGSLGDDLNKLEQDLNQLFGALIPSSSISRADKLSAVMRGSLSDAGSYQNLLLLARNHPAIDLALGFADAELVTNSTTFEVRAYDPATAQDLAVIGRVTVTAGQPASLPPPGPPVLVPEPTPKGDLNLKFRWGTPDELRRLSLLQSGYNLYRVALGYAADQGWNEAKPPSIAALTSLVAANPAAARRINLVPITPGTNFTLTEAAFVSPPGDTNTFFIMDDDGRGKANYVNYGFTNGAQFFYYVSARDVLGRDTTISPGLLATVCDRMPPLPPTGVRVVNNYTFNPGTPPSSSQVLQVNWKQNLFTNDVVTNYWIYRWTSITQMNMLSGDPNSNLIAKVPHIPNATNNSYVDSGPGAPSAPNDYSKTFWYTVRAGDAGACGQNLSGAAGPAFGVLRQRNGPASATGHLEINCLRPSANLLSSTLRVLPGGPDTNNYDVKLTCSSLSQHFEWAEFYGIAQYTPVGGGAPTIVSNFLGLFSCSAGSAVSTWWRPPRTSQQFRVTLRVGCCAALRMTAGPLKASSFTTAPLSPPDFAFYNDAEFSATAQVFRTIAGDTNNPGCTMHFPALEPSPANYLAVVVSASDPSAREYRIYRRVDDGPLTLLAQSGVTNPVTLATVTNYDNAAPLNGGTICYYVQLLDENGNPSPLTSLGCVDCAPSTPLPVPVLAKITPTGDASSPGMNLSWFCPPYGVERFEVLIGGAPSPPDTNYPSLSAKLASEGESIPMVVTNAGNGETLLFYSFVTPRVGPAFGTNGADFALPCNIELGKTYFVAVRALGKRSYAGDLSGTEAFLWSPTNPPSFAQVPWPARGLPGTNANFPPLIACYLSPTSNPPSIYTGTGVCIGSATLGAGVTVDNSSGSTCISAFFDPNSAVSTNDQNEPLFPCVLYRYQVPNANFPTTSGDVIQVSPLMETIAYATNQPCFSGTNKVPVRVQVATAGTGLLTTNLNFTVNLASAPAVGNTLVAVISTTGSIVPSSIPSPPTYWNRAVISGNGGPSTEVESNAVALYDNTEILYAPVVRGEMTSVTIPASVTILGDYGTAPPDGRFWSAAAVIMEYSGLLAAGALDQTSIADWGSGNTNGTTAVTGTTATTTQANELWVGGIGFIPTLSSFSNSFALAGSASAYENGTNSGFYPTTYALDKMVSATGAASSGGTINPPSFGWFGAIATFKAQSSTGRNYGTAILDPFVTSTTWTNGSSRVLSLWLLDTQPQISGARYKYVLVRFKANHEIDQLIPSNEVEVP